MWFIKKNKELRPVPAEGKWVSKIREKMAHSAQWFTRQTASYSKRKWLVVLGFFCLCFGLWSMAVIYSSLSARPSKPVLPKVPVSISRPPVQKPLPSKRIPETDMEKVARFERHFDSLPRDVQDSLVRRRPGLFDTVAQLKRLYAEQNGNDSTPVFNNPK